MQLEINTPVTYDALTTRNSCNCLLVDDIVFSDSDLELQSGQETMCVHTCM